MAAAYILLDQQQMNLTDLIIIYLACGAPFGVYQITKRQDVGSSAGWISISSSFLLWPAAAASLVIGRIFFNSGQTELDRRTRIEKIRIEIENAAFSGDAVSAVFEFREIFYRFIGLSEAAYTMPAGKSVNEIFKISGHKNAVLASRCLSRRSIERLAFHQDKAQDEFVELVKSLTAPQQERIVRLILELADHLPNRYPAVDLVDALTVQKKPHTRQTPDLEKDVWKSITRSTQLSTDRG